MNGFSGNAAGPARTCGLGEISTHWNLSKGKARVLLRDRPQRRKLLANLLFIAFFLMATGWWGIDGWLALSPWRFLIWWGACGALACGALLFALYDALAVVREEREKALKDDGD